MNVNDMSDQEKSNSLCNLCGWSIVEFMQHYDYRLMDANDNEIESFPDWYQTDGDMPDLYNPANMALAWRVLNWASEQQGIYHKFMHWWFRQNSDLDMLGGYLFDLEPEDAQRAWLDKILSLAIEAGMLEATK